MKKSISTCIAVCAMFLAANVAASDPEHTISYEARSKGVGKTLEIAGMQFRMIKIPVRDLVTGQKFHVIFPATMYGTETYGSIRTSHATDLPEGSNITIAGYPAHYYLDENVFYDFSAYNGMSFFWVGGFVDITVTIDIGGTLISISTYFEMANPQTGFPPLTDADMGNSFNAAPFANWSRYKDPLSLVRGADKWVDFVKIKEL
jgi:hypothetical protein